MRIRPVLPADEQPQLHRMAEEVRHILDRLLAGAPAATDTRNRLLDELSWWQDVDDRPLDEAVERSFLLRQVILRSAPSDGTWRNALSYIGDPDPVDEQVCTYDYDRAEIRFAPDSPLARPYAWMRGDGCAVETWYSRTGMSAITAWLIAVARMAAERGMPHLVLTNRLYHEAEILFDMARLADVTVRKHDDLDSLLAAANEAEHPVVIFLDSSRPDGTAAALTRLLREIDPTKVGSVLWDNTCASASDSPFEPAGPSWSEASEAPAAPLPVEPLTLLDLDDDGVGQASTTPRLRTDELTTTLVVLRSHAKLDQLGLELCSLGSVVMMTGPANTGEGPHWQTGMQRFFADSLAVTGACASPATLRLMASLGLPDESLSRRANRHLRQANALAARILIDELTPTGRYQVEENEHGCFVEIHLLELPGPEPIGGPPTWPVWDELDRELTRIGEHAAERSIPIWKSASFGFHYTGLSWYSAEDPPRPQGHAHTVLRVCFGMHDPAVTAEAAEIIAEHLTRKSSWTPIS
ncbi:hypothetical protein FHR81_000982 [Actinoalloteichus hoggarensis]|nr:hypothetical protein [Actinoalloteichus hoggarensis]MBB5919952.1 hypothetical protein [Actinoalloteichus hoggarensis]